MTLTETPAAGAIASIIKATQRLNPCMELDVDVLAVTRAAVNSTSADWTAGTPTNITVDPSTGTVRLSLVAPAPLFSQVNAASVIHAFHDSTTGAEEYALDFFLDPSVAQGVHFELDSLDLYLGRIGGVAGGLLFDKSGVFRVWVGFYDQDWKLVTMGDAIDISATLINLTGAIYKIDFTALQRRFVFAPGNQNTSTGAGFDGTAIRTLNVDTKGVSHIPNTARGLSISIQPMGKGFQNAFIGCVANATAAQFDKTTFWRHVTNRECGPYNPTNQPFTGSDINHNPDDRLWTGAVPNYGAIAGTVAGNTTSKWGIARRPTTPQRAQGSGATGSWEQPYHVLRVKAYSATGSIVSVLDMGAVPTNPVELRLDDWQQNGTSIAYTLKGSNISSAGAWTAITLPSPLLRPDGTPNSADGSILTGTDLYRWYQLTAAFLPGPSGATKYASPALQSWSMVERVAITTYRYLKDVDSTTVVDPVTAQSSIGELKLPVMTAGRIDFRDLAAQLGSNYSPAFLEAHVYARNTRSGVRLFLNAYRLENRDPRFGAEEMTFVSGMDRLTVKVPAAQETFRYPAVSGTAPATTVTNPSGTTFRIAPGGTPFTATALAGMRMHGVTGQCAGLDYPIQAGNTTAYFEIITGGLQSPPLSGDTFEIHSDATTRTGAVYVGSDFAAIYNDLLAVQAAVPARYRGKLPPTTGRTATYTLPSAGIKALDVLQDVALHCDGFPAWIKGRISYVDFYGKKDSVVTWGDREIVTLETPVGMDRRMPSVKVKYGYDAGTQNFTNETTYNDFDTVVGVGRANLFDTFDLPDNVCVWNDLAESKNLASKLQNAWKSGVRIWKVKTVLYYPWLDQGDAVTIQTDQYTDRRMSFSADGLTDLGVPIAGRTSSVAVIIGKNLWGNEFVVAVRGLDAVTSGSAAVATGSVAVPILGTQAPVALITPLNTEVDDTVWNFSFNATVGSGGGGANLTYTIKSKSGIATDTTLSSGDATAFPLTLGVARNPRVSAFLRFTVTDTLTGLSNTATWTAPSQRPEVDATGRVQRARTWSDGFYGGVATTSDGLRLHTGAAESGLKLVNRLLGKALAGDPDSLDGVPEGTSYKRVTVNAITGGNIDFTLAGFTGKSLANVPDDAGTDRRAATANQKTGGDRGIGGFTNATGGLVSTSTESGGKAVNRLLGKALAGDPDSADGLVDGTIKRAIALSVIRASDNSLLTSVDYAAKIGDVNAQTLSKRDGIYFSETFEGGLTLEQMGWSIFNSSGMGSIIAASPADHAVGGNLYRITGASASTWQYALFPRKIPFNRTKLYRIRVRIKCTTDKTLGVNPNQQFIGVRCFLADGSLANNNGGNAYVGMAGTALTVAGGWIEQTGWFKGDTLPFASGTPGYSNDPTAPSALSLNTAYIAPLVLLNFDGNNAVNVLDYIQIDEMDEDAAGRTYTAINSSRKVIRSIGMDDGNYAAAATNTAGTALHGNCWESGGKAVNRLLGKALAADPDNLSGVPDSLVRFAAIQAGADKTSSNTAADATNVNGVAAATVQGGAARANTGLDANGRITDTLHHGALVAAGPGAFVSPIAGPLSSSGAVISIAAHTLHVGGTNISYNSGSITTTNGTTTYYVYTDDPTFAGGAVTYLATTSRLTLSDNPGRYYVGQITTTSTVGNSASGGGSGIRPL